MTNPEPTIKPKLKRDGPDAYIGQLDYWATKPRARQTPVRYRVERDGGEWVQMDTDYTGRPKPRAWYRTLDEFRDYIAESNVARWVNSAGQDRASAEHREQAWAFVRWAKQQVPGDRCPGTRRELPRLGGIVSHDRCCDHIIKKPLPDGVTILTLYREWSTTP